MKNSNYRLSRSMMKEGNVAQTSYGAEMEEEELMGEGKLMDDAPTSSKQQ